MKKIVIFIGLCLVLGIALMTVFVNENILKNGKTVILELAPVDPRSLMQGDYMVLSYALARQFRDLPFQNLPTDAPWKERAEESTRAKEDFEDGYIVVSLDERDLAKASHLVEKPPSNLGERETFLRYRVRNGHLKIATNAFFFQEGTGHAFDLARFGEFRVGENGEPRLVGLRDANNEPITATHKETSQRD